MDAFVHSDFLTWSGLSTFECSIFYKDKLDGSEKIPKD
jgi:hypothetical protein